MARKSFSSYTYRLKIDKSRNSPSVQKSIVGSPLYLETTLVSLLANCLICSLDWIL